MKVLYALNGQEVHTEAEDVNVSLSAGTVIWFRLFENTLLGTTLPSNAWMVGHNFCELVGSQGS